MSQQIQAWDVSKAAAQAAEGKAPVRLVRADGTSAGLIVTPEGQLRRATLKPRGKAARKEFKALRRQVRGLDPVKNASTIRILAARARNLCLPEGAK